MSTPRRRSTPDGSRATDGVGPRHTMRNPPNEEIGCVTPNPALDRTLEVPGFRAGETMRAGAARVAAGGKGLNVARGLSVLGAHPLCMGPLGGISGRLLADLAS